MKIFLVFLGLLIHHACAQFTFGFGLKEYCAVEGDDYQYCIVVVNGVAPAGGFDIIVDTTIGMFTYSMQLVASYFRACSSVIYV